MKQKSFNKELLEFLNSSVTPFHAVESMKTMLLDAEFIELCESEEWKLTYGKKYFITRSNSSIIAFNYNKGVDYLLLGAHTDSPTLKVKPNPVIKKDGCVQLAVEPYGGVLFSTWFDRDLALAGEVSFLNEDDEIEYAIINTCKAIASIPSLAIHLDKEANSNKSINAQTDIVPIISTDKKFNFSKFIAKELNSEELKMKKLLTHELSFYETQKASLVGVKNEFISSARLDNLLSCYVAVQTLISSNKNVMIVCNDHEEVGSSSVSGAAGTFLEHSLNRVFKENIYAMLRESLLISCDNAHAIHPNFSAKHDANHAPHINGGVVIKTNSNQRYATSPKSSAEFIKCAYELNLKVQQFVTRSDMGCGSTIGPISATKLGINTLDIGLPTYAMHSCRELAGSKDAFELYKILLHLK
ncbi:MAG: M18 family aminopeptidase [Campylobacterota bacterium]|nr:M18 family aminopeptidase [Campylobacterota bacterium]